MEWIEEHAFYGLLTQLGRSIPEKTSVTNRGPDVQTVSGYRPKVAQRPYLLKPKC